MSFWAPEQLEPWLAHLHAGGVAAAPAEGAYGYVANPLNPESLNKIMDLKQRDPGKGLIVLVSRYSQISQFCAQPLPQPCAQAMATYWKKEEKPTTLLLPARKTLPQLLTGGKPTIAIRLPNEPYMIEYIESFGGPLVSTSLNLSGEAPALEASKIPAKIPALTLKNPLSGALSRIYNPMENKWLR